MQTVMELEEDRYRFEEPDPLPDTTDAIDFAQRVAQVGKAQLGDQVEELWLYGSRARGDQKPGSDLDLLTVTSDPDDKGYRTTWKEIFRGLKEKHPIELNIIHVSRDQTETWDTRFYRNFRRDRIRVV